MIDRIAKMKIIKLMSEFPTVGILEPRQVGKTTLVFEIAKDTTPAPIYLDQKVFTWIVKI